MNIYDYSNIKQLFVVGDIHGEFNNFFNIIRRNLNMIKNTDEREEFIIKVQNNKGRIYYNDSVIIVCGDCGFGFNKQQYYFDIFNKINSILADSNTHIIFVRGNHDDPSYFNDEIINMSNIKSVPDYSVIKTFGNNTLCVGGAISVDRLWRKQQEIRLNKYSKNKKLLYWEDENVIINENILSELKENNIQLTNVVTHTCPSFAFPYEKDTAISWFKFDKDLRTDIDNERKMMDWLFSTLTSEHNIKTWSYGHFHLMSEEMKNGVLFIANDDSISIKNPLTLYNSIKEYEEENKKKKKRRSKKNVDVNRLTTDMLDELFDNNNNHVLNLEIDNAPF